MPTSPTLDELVLGRGSARVLCVGIATIDEVMTVDALPTGEAKLLAADRYQLGGGVAANAAVAIARLGGDAAFGGLLGDDPIGDLAGDGLAAEGVDTSAIVRVPGSTTPLSVVLLDRAGRRLVVNHAAPGFFERPAPDRVRGADDADAVLVDTRWPAGAVAALRAARARGIPGVVDADRPLVGPALQVARAASHVVFSRDALLGTTGDDDIDIALRRAGSPPAERPDVGHPPPWVAVTDGPRGVWWLDPAGHTICHVAAHAVDAVDTLGAGDTFHGAFTLALAEGADEVIALGFASAVAAVKCTRRGGRDGFPTRGQVATFLHQQAPRAPGSGGADLPDPSMEMS